MRRTILGVLVGSLVALGLPWLAEARVVYDERGKVSLDGTYEGPGFTKADLLPLVAGTTGTVLLLGGVFSEPAASAVIPASIIWWGVTRTNRYRPAEVAQRIRANIAKNAAKPRPGTTAEVLGW